MSSPSPVAGRKRTVAVSRARGWPLSSLVIRRNLLAGIFLTAGFLVSTGESASTGLTWARSKKIVNNHTTLGNLDMANLGSWNQNSASLGYSLALTFNLTDSCVRAILIG